MYSMSAEEWRRVPGINGYEVSDLGRVRSHRRRAPRIMQGSRHMDGYLQISVHGDDSRRSFLVHRLVLLAFVGPPPTGTITRHLDGDPSNNRLENLTYGTQSENVLDAVRHGRNWEANKTHCPQGHAYDETNTRHYRGERHCWTCRRTRDREAKRRASAAAA